MTYDELSLETAEQRDAATAKHLLGMAQLSYQQESARYTSLVEHGDRLLISTSIVFVTLALLLQAMVGHMDAIVSQRVDVTPVAEVVLFRVYVFAVVLTVAAAFITALIASTHFRYTLLESPAEMVSFIQEQDLFPSQTAAAMHYCTSLQASYESLNRRNEKIRGLLKVSMILLIVAVGIAAAGGLVVMFFI